MTIVPYDSKYKDKFVELNKAWISDMFSLEPLDELELSNIEKYIDAGGQMFFAVNDDDDVMACCMISPRDDGDWEIMKFAASDKYKGSGAGKACLKAFIEYVRARKVPKIIIVSNKRCVQAVHLYRKYGFVEVPVDKEKFPFERADIAFEMEI